MAGTDAGGEIISARQPRPQPLRRKSPPLQGLRSKYNRDHTASSDDAPETDRSPAIAESRQAPPSAVLSIPAYRAEARRISRSEGRRVMVRMSARVPPELPKRRRARRRSRQAAE